MRGAWVVHATLPETRSRGDRRRRSRPGALYPLGQHPSMPRCLAMKLLALGSVVPRSVGPHSIGSAEAGHRVGLSAGMSFCLSFHLALLGPTGAHWLDDPPDRSCKDSTRQHLLDGSRLSVNSRFWVRVRRRLEKAGATVGSTWAFGSHRTGRGRVIRGSRSRTLRWTSRRAPGRPRRGDGRRRRSSGRAAGRPRWGEALFPHAAP
jgi:hypothetical protein